jgi:hypothetical protein
MAILHRKNSLSFKTLHGARIGDVHMSLIHTCELNRVNPFDYLMALQQHAAAVPKAPDSGSLGIISKPSRQRAAVDSPGSRARPHRTDEIPPARGFCRYAS